MEERVQPNVLEAVETSNRFKYCAVTTTKQCDTEILSFSQKDNLVKQKLSYLDLPKIVEIGRNYHFSKV